VYYATLQYLENKCLGKVCVLWHRGQFAVLFQKIIVSELLTIAAIPYRAAQYGQLFLKAWVVVIVCDEKSTQSRHLCLLPVCDFSDTSVQ